MVLGKILKYTLGLFYLLVGPLLHGYLMTYQRTIYVSVADTAWAPYQLFWVRSVLPNLPLLITLLVLFELVAGVCMLSWQAPVAVLGQLGGLLFNLLLLPFWFFYGIPNLLLVIVHGWLLLQERRTWLASPLQPMPSSH
ncbi:MAG: hypothetical protein NT075_08460 [Chloroflexi bacterium]|nr:hypothetical protein [Chloroflexota bacterium]